MARRRARRESFGADFRRFFLRGLNALAPTLITLAILYYVLNFLWRSMGWFLIEGIKRAWWVAAQQGWVDPVNRSYIARYWADQWYTPVLGVLLALLVIYVVGLAVGNLLGRGIYSLTERLVLRVPIVRQIYPAVKQVTDLFLAEKDAEGEGGAAGQFSGSKVVAVRYRDGEVWNIGLVTGGGMRALDTEAGRSVSVFVPSSPTAFSGYVVIVPRESVRELPLTVDEAMRLLVSGGVVAPDAVVDKAVAGPADRLPPPPPDV